MADQIDRIIASARDAALDIRKSYTANDALALLGIRAASDSDAESLWSAVYDATRIWLNDRPNATRGSPAWDDLRRAAREAARTGEPRTDEAARAAAERFKLKGRAPLRLWFAAYRAEEQERRLRARPERIAEEASAIADDAVERAAQLGRDWAAEERERRLARYQRWLEALTPLELIDFVTLLRRSPAAARSKVGVVVPEGGSWILDEAVRVEHERRRVGFPGSPESRQALLAQDNKRTGAVVSPEKRAALAEAEALRRRIDELRTRVQRVPMPGGPGLMFDPAGALAGYAAELPDEVMAYGHRTSEDLRDLVAQVAEDVDDIERRYAKPAPTPPPTARIEPPAPANEPAEAALLDKPILVPGEAWRYEEGADGWDTPWRPVTLRPGEGDGALYQGLTSVSGGGEGPKGSFHLFEWPDGQRAAQRAGMSPPSRDYRDRSWRVAQRKEKNVAKEGFSLDVQDGRRRRGAEQPGLQGLDVPVDTRDLYERKVRGMAAKAGQRLGIKGYNERMRAAGLPPVRTQGDAEREQLAPAAPTLATPATPATPANVSRGKRGAKKPTPASEAAAKAKPAPMPATASTASRGKRGAKKPAPPAPKPTPARAKRAPKLRAEVVAAMPALLAQEDAAAFGPVDWTGVGITDRVREHAVAIGFARLVDDPHHFGPRYQSTPLGREAVGAGRGVEVTACCGSCASGAACSLETPSSAPAVDAGQAAKKAAKKTAKKTAKKKTAKKKAAKKKAAKKAAKKKAAKKKAAKKWPKPASPRSAGDACPRKPGAIGRLVDRYTRILLRRSSVLKTRQASRRDQLVAKQQARERDLAGRQTGGPATRANAERRLKVAERKHAQQRRALEARDRAELDALKAGVECQVLGKARVAKIVRQGCEDLCTLNLDGGIGGDKTAVALPSSRSAPRTLPARYVLVSAASLIASHDPITFDPRPDYPSKVQERRYDRDNLEKGKVIQVAQNMLPALLQNTDIGAANGTPVVTPGRLVLSGNGRTMGTQRHYQSGRRVLADWLERHAAQFGIDPRAVKAIKDPIVVRVIDVPQADFGRLVRDANVSLTQSMGADVEAAALARQLPADVPRLLRDGGADAGLAEYLGSRASLPLVGALERSGYLTSSNRGRLLGSDGLLSSDGRADLERMLVASVLPVEVVERSPELAKALDRSAVSWLAAAGAGPDWDVRADLAAAAEDYLALRSSRSCLAQWQEQGSMVQRATDGRPMARAMLEVLDLAAARPVVFARIAQAFAAASRESSLFASVDPLDALRAAAAANNAPTERAASRRRCRKAA